MRGGWAQGANSVRYGTVREPAMKTIDDLRDEGARCRRLAEGIGNRELADKLIALAVEIEAAAETRERATEETS